MRILWSDFASETLRDIYKYYKTAAGIPIAKKIKTEIFLATKQLIAQPESGQIEISLEKINEGHR